MGTGGILTIGHQKTLCLTIDKLYRDKSLRNINVFPYDFIVIFLSRLSNQRFVRSRRFRFGRNGGHFIF